MTKPITREKSPLIACTVSGTVYTLYTCPANCRARVPFLYITNANGTATANIKIYKAAQAISYFILGGKNLAQGEFVEIQNDAGFILEPGDRIDVTATGTTVNVDAICTVVEQFIPVG